MKTAGLVALTVALLGATTMIAPLVAAGVAAIGGHAPFTRIYNRVFEVLLVIALVATWRRLDLGGPAAWGLRRDGWSRALGVGLAIGLAGIAVGLVAAWVGGGLVPALRFDAFKTVRKALLGIGAAMVVGVGEETLFRGILLRRFSLDLGARGGLALTTIIYGIVHALRGGKVASVGPWAGVERTLGLFAPLGNPATLAGVAGLCGLGLLLAVARQRTGSLWVPIGIHAAWVGVFRVGRLFFDIRQRPAWLVGPGWPPLVGGAAGLLALVVSAWTLRDVLAKRAVARNLP